MLKPCVNKVFWKVIHDICVPTRHRLRLENMTKGLGILVSRFDPEEVVTALLHSHLKEVTPALP
jgi:hypothetical protein